MCFCLVKKKVPFRSQLQKTKTSLKEILFLYSVG